MSSLPWNYPYARARFGKLVQYSAKLKYTDLDNIFPGAKLEGGMGGGVTPPKYELSGLAGRIIWIGRAIKDFK
jgi:hypothetical protein